MHVNRPGLVNNPLRCTQPHIAPQSSLRANDQLRCIDRAGELQQNSRHIITHDGAPLPTQRLGEILQLAQPTQIPAVKAVVLAGNVHDNHLAAGHAPGHAGTAANHGLRVLIIAHGHHDALTRGPVVVDLLVFAVGIEHLLDLVSQPQKCQLTQGAEVARAEVLAQR